MCVDENLVLIFWKYVCTYLRKYIHCCFQSLIPASWPLVMYAYLLIHFIAGTSYIFCYPHHRQYTLRSILSMLTHFAKSITPCSDKKLYAVLNPAMHSYMTIASYILLCIHHHHGAVNKPFPGDSGQTGLTKYSLFINILHNS